MVYIIQLILGIALHLFLAAQFSSGTIHGKIVFISFSSVFEKVTLIALVILMQFSIYLGLKKWGRFHKTAKIDLGPHDRFFVYLLSVILCSFIVYSIFATETWVSKISIATVILNTLFIFFAAFFEELVFRGYYFKQLITRFPKAMWGIIIVQAAFFAQGHMDNPDSTVIMMMNIFLIGVILGIAAINHFTAVVVFHFLWNYFSGFVFGLPVSGYLFYESLARPKQVYNWEGSVVLFFLLLLPTMVLIYFMIQSAKKKSFKIGVVDFLNAYPLYYGLENLPHVELVREIPSRLSTLLKEKKLDAALVSSIEYYKNRTLWKYHPDLCISSSKGVESIRVFFKTQTAEQNGDFNTLTERLSSAKLITIYYDRASRSSVEILKLLLIEKLPRTQTRFIEINPPFEQKLDNLKPEELLLLIGDEALRNRNRASIDLGSWFTATFQQPAVYALWCYPENHSPELPSILLEGFAQSKSKWNQMLQKAGEIFKFDFDFVKKYLEINIQYTLDESRSKALTFFFEKYSAVAKQTDKDK
ncbi:MAG: MqnA/MqnD/SBP family protein [Leptospirales bacterium]